MADTGDVIPVMDFKEHVRKLHMNKDYLFSEEYSVSVLCSGLVSLASSHMPESQYNAYKTILYTPCIVA